MKKTRFFALQSGKSPGCNRRLRKFQAFFLVCNGNFGYIWLIRTGQRSAEMTTQGVQHHDSCG